MQPLFCLIQKLKRSSAENSRTPETLVVELSLSLLRCLSSLLSLSPARHSLSPRRLSLSPARRSLSPRRRTLSLSSPAPCGGGVTGSQSPLPFLLFPDPDPDLG
ncbi:hypothetical protein YC2023_015658 [Brassica napus]